MPLRSLCLFFGVMFAFALENDELAAAWLESVVGSILFWLFISRPLIIIIKTSVSKCKAEKKAKKKRTEFLEKERSGHKKARNTSTQRREIEMSNTSFYVQEAQEENKKTRKTDAYWKKIDAVDAKILDVADAVII